VDCSLFESGDRSLGQITMEKFNQFCINLLFALAAFASNSANADWYVKDIELRETAKILATEVTVAAVSKAVSAVETEVKNIKDLSLGTGSNTDNVNTKLKTINENVTELTNQFSFNTRTFPTYQSSNYLNQFKTVTVSLSSTRTVTVFISPKLKCDDLMLEDTKSDIKMGAMSQFGAIGTAAWAKAQGYLLGLSNGSGKAYENMKALNTACKNINKLVAEMYEEANSFNSQISGIQEKINSYKSVIKPKPPATSAGTSSSATSSENKTDSYADLAMISLELQIIQASQANIIGVHASNAAMFKFQIQTAKELYLKLALKRMLG
jgi:flagellar biosynthesis/type III secretory pathway protein FliH